MTKDKMRLPLTAVERCEQQLREALDAFEDLMRQKTVVDNLERFDVARDFILASDHLRIAKLLVIDGMRKAALVAAPAANTEPT